ncbi:MAG: hypothetical protein ACHBMF_03720 [Chromatiales bacterium]
MRLSKTDHYWWPIAIEVQEEDGEITTLSGEFKFKRMREPEVDGIIKTSGANDVAICRIVVCEWREFRDVEGEDIRFSGENLNEVLSYPIAAAAIVRGWARSLSAVHKKN